jgi:hypothetical protein
MMNSSGSSLPAEVRDRVPATADTGLRAAVTLAVAEGELTVKHLGRGAGHRRQELALAP